MSTFLYQIFETLALKVASNKLRACKTLIIVPSLYIIYIMLVACAGTSPPIYNINVNVEGHQAIDITVGSETRIVIYEPTKLETPIDKFYRSFTQPVQFAIDASHIPEFVRNTCTHPELFVYTMHGFTSLITGYIIFSCSLASMCVNRRIARNTANMRQKIRKYFILLSIICILLSFNFCVPPIGIMEILATLILPVYALVFVEVVYYFMIHVAPWLSKNNPIVAFKKYIFQKTEKVQEEPTTQVDRDSLRTESDMKPVTLKLAKGSSLRPENDPNSNYSRGVTNAKIRHRHEKKKEFNIKQRETRISRTKRREKHPFPEPTTRDFDRYRLYKKFTKPKTEGSIPFSIYLDIFATLYSKESLPTKLALLRHKAEIVIKRKTGKTVTLETVFIKVVTTFLKAVDDNDVSGKEILLDLLSYVKTIKKDLIMSIATDVISFLTVIASCKHNSSITEEAVLILRKYNDLPFLDDLAPLLSMWNSVRQRYTIDELNTESFLLEYAQVLDDTGFSDFLQYGVVFISAISKLKMIPEWMDDIVIKWFPLLPIVGDAIAIKKLASSVLHIADCLIDLIDGKVSARELIMGEPVIHDIMESATSLLALEDRAVTGVVAKGYICAKDFCARAENLLVEIESNQYRVKKKTKLRAVYLDLQSDLQRAYLEVSTRLYAERREAPFMIYLYGTPGVGKGLIIDLILQTYCVAMGVKYEQNMVYHRGPGDEYWEGYYPFAKWFIHMSEVASDKADLLRAKGDDRISEITSLADTQPYHVNMAFAGKGKVFAIPKGIIADSNVRNMGVEHHRACPSAYLRRPLFVDASINEHYVIPGTTQLDPMKLPQGKFSPDAYRFAIRKYYADGDKNFTETVVLSDLTWQELEQYLLSYYAEFVQHETTVKTQFQEFMDTRNEGLRDINTESFRIPIYYPIPIVLLLLCSLVQPVLVLIALMLVLISCQFKYEIYTALGYAYVDFTIGNIYNSTIDHLVSLRDKISSVFSPSLLTKEAALASLTFLGGCGILIHKCRETRLKTEAQVCDELRTFEEKIEASESYPRVKTQNHAVWNRIFNTFSPAHKGAFDEGQLNLLSSYRKISVFIGGNFVTHAGSTMGFGVCEDILLLNRHPLGNDLSKASIVIHSANEQDSSQVHIQMEDAIYLDMGNDLILLKHPSMRFKNRLKHIVSKEAIIAENADAIIDGYRTRLHSIESSVVVNDAMCGDITYQRMVSYHWPSHRPGKCGTPLIALVGNGQTIVGIHSAAGKDSLSLARLINREEIVCAIEALYKLSPLGRAVSESHYFPVSLTTPGLKSPWRFEDINQLKYIGTTPGLVMINNKSNLKPTVFKPHLKAIFKNYFKQLPTERYGKPLMRPIVNKDGNYVSPFNNWYRKADHVQFSQNKDIISQTIDTMVVHFKEGLSHLKGKVKPLTIKCAINGAPCDPFIGRMNASTSAGFGWKGKKDNHIPIDPDILDEVERMPTAELEDTLLQMCEHYQNNLSLNICQVAKPKDEPRVLQKCIDGKTRFFFLSPIEQVIFARIFLAPLYSLMVEHGALFSTSVGINAHADWDELIRDFKEFSPYIMEGDISGFDTHVAILCRAGVIEVIIQLLEFLGYNEESLGITRAFLSDGLHSFVQLNNDVFIAMGLQPSGKYGTAEDNSLLLLFKLIYWYIQTMGDNKFYDNVLLRTYGDDCLIAIKESHIEHLNNNSLKTFYAKHMNIVYTAADKSLTMNDFNDIMECSFLKRYTKYSEKYDKYMGTLNINSMYKMLEWLIPSSFITEEEQLLAMCESFLWEAFFHLEPNEHMSVRNILQDILSLEYPGCNVSQLPTHSKVCARMGWDIQPKESITTESKVVFTNARAARNGYDNPVHNKNQSSNMSSMSGCVLGEKLSSNDLKIRIPEDSEILPKYNPQLLRNTYKNAALSSTPSTQKRFFNFKKELEKARLREILEFPVMDKKTRIVTESDIMPIIESGTIEETKMDVVHNMGDTSGQEKVHEQAMITRSRPAGQKEVQTISNFLERVVEVSNFVIPVSVPADTSVILKVWDIITTEPSIRAKLKNFAYLNCDLEISLNISGTPFHYGKILVSYQPYPLRNEVLKVLLARVAIDPVNYRPLLLNYLSQAPGAKVMDVKDNQPLVMHLPFISPKPMHRLFNSAATVLTDATSFHDLEDCGSLFIYSLNQSASASASPTDISVYVYGRMTNVALGTLTATQTQITTEAKDDEWTGGPVERTSAAIASFLGKLSVVPEIAPLAVPGSMVFKGVSGIASYFGWSKPVTINDVNFVKELPFSNGALTTGKDSALRMTLDPKQALTVDSSFMTDNSDELIITELASKSSFLTTFLWDETDDPMSTPLWKSAVTPDLYTFYNVLSRTYYQPTPCAFAVKPFKYWNGTLMFTIEIVCSAYHRGKLAIIYEPNIDQHALISANSEPNKQYLQVVDIQDSQTITFCVNWAAPFPWLKTAPEDGNGIAYRSAYGVTPALETFSGYANGFIRICPFTKLQSPDGSDVSVNVYVSCPDLQVQGPAQGNLPVDRTGLTTESLMKPFDKSMVGVSCLDVNESSAKTDYINLDYFGESIKSFRSLLKRYHAHLQLVGTVGQTQVMNAILNIQPSQEIAWNTLGVHSSLYEYLRFAYLGVRGSFRYRFEFAKNKQLVLENNALFSTFLREPTDSYITEAFDAGITRVRTPLTGCIKHSGKEPHVNVDLPFYTSNLFLFPCSGDYVGTNQAGNMELEWYRDFQIQTDLGNFTAGDLLDVDMATGEDFNLMRFQGAVPFTVAQT